MYFNSSTSLLNNQLCQNYNQNNGNQFCATTQLGESSADEQETDETNSNIRPAVTLHNCLNQLEKCTVENCALNIFDNVVVKEELIIDDYEDSESVIENYYYDSFEKWSEFGQPLKTFLQNSNFNYHVEDNYLNDKMHEDSISNNSSYDDSSNSLAGSTDKTIVIRNPEWALEKVFKSEDLAISYLYHNNWSLRVRYNTQYGYKSIYRCNLVKNKMPQCAAKVSMEYNKKTKTFLVYNNRRKHTHGTILVDQSNSDPDVHQKVIELSDLGLSKYEIQLHLENNGYNVSTDSALVNKSGAEPTEPLPVKLVEMKPKLEYCNKKYYNSKWILEKKFVNFAFALQYMKDTGLWAICSKKRGRKQDKQYYRCNRVRKVGPQCAAQKYLLMDHSTREGFLFGINEHTHDLILAMSAGNAPRQAIKTEPESDNDENVERKMDEGTFSTTEADYINSSSVNANDESKDRLSWLPSIENKITDHFWILNRTFKNGAAVKLFLDDHKIWELKYRELNGIGLKCIYRCRLVEPNVTPQCASMAYAQYHAKNDKVFFYTNSLEHTHSLIMKNDSNKICNKLFRDHPKTNGLNSHIRNDWDISEAIIEPKIESPRERLNLRKMKSEPLTLQIDKEAKSPEPELVEYVPPKRRVLPWKLEKEFDKLKDALAYMENKPTWYMWKKQNFKYGGSSKSYYKCTIKTDSEHCPGQKHLFVDKTSNKISIFRCHDHSHEPTSPIPSSPIPFENPTLDEPPTNDDKPPINDDNIENVTENASDPSNSDTTQLSCSTNGTWGNNWSFERKFRIMPEAIRYMKGEEIWSICGKLKVFSGYRQYYRCNLVKKSGPQCDSKKYLFFNSPTSEVLLYGCNSHTHDLILTQTVKSEIDVNEDGEKSSIDTDEKRYVLDRKFKNLDLALSYINEANTWTHHSSLKSLTGVRRYYLCKLRGNRKGSLQCKARCCLSLKSAKQEVVLYNRSCSHTHPIPYKQVLKRGRKKSCKVKKSHKKTYSMPKLAKTSHNLPERYSIGPSKTIRSRNTWHLERNFINSEFALKYMKKEKIWSIYSKRRTNNGNDIQYYRCNEVKKTGPQCAAQKYLMFHSNRAKVSLYGRNEHTHEAILAGKINENEEDDADVVLDNNDTHNYIDDNEGKENTNDDAYDEPLNENLYAVDVVIEEEEPSAPVTESKPKRGRGLGLNYVFEKRFRNSKTALTYIKSLKIWSVTFTGKSGKSYRQRFRCNMVGRKGPQCAARKYLVYDPKGVRLFTSITDHTHESILSSNRNEEIPSQLNFSLNKTVEKVNKPEDLPADTNQTKQTGKKPRQGWKRKFYNLERKFKNAQAATNYMKTQKEWGLHSKTKREYDMKQYYRCNYVKVGGPQCQAGKFLLYSQLKKEVSLFYCNNHTHDSILQNIMLNESDSLSEANDENADEVETEPTKDDSSVVD